MDCSRRHTALNMQPSPEFNSDFSQWQASVILVRLLHLFLSLFIPLEFSTVSSVLKRPAWFPFRLGYPSYARLAVITRPLDLLEHAICQALEPIVGHISDHGVTASLLTNSTRYTLFIDAHHILLSTFHVFRDQLHQLRAVRIDLSIGRCIGQTLHDILIFGCRFNLPLVILVR